MMTLRLFSRKVEFVPASTSWYLADLGEARGKQELFTRQSPQRLKLLREHALIESAVSSNRIEGVEVDKSRIATIIFGKPLLRDREEEEVRGYRQALTLIHNQGAELPVSEETILRLHHLTRGEIWDAGKLKEKDGDRLGRLQSPRGEKTGLVLHAIDRALGPFRIAELKNECPNVSVDMIRRVLKNLRAKKQVECLGRGQNAQWRKTSKWQLGNTE